MVDAVIALYLPRSKNKLKLYEKDFAAKLGLAKVENHQIESPTKIEFKYIFAHRLVPDDKVIEASVF